MSQVFTSYSRKDHAFVQRLVAHLAARLPKSQIFYNMLLPPGKPWAEALVAQIERVNVILVLLSPDHLESPWAKQELNVASERQLKKRARLLPLLVRPCTPRGFLSQLTWVDCTDDHGRALALLIRGITDERPRPAKPGQPGVAISPLDANESEVPRHTIQAVVELFKCFCSHSLSKMSHSISGTAVFFCTSTRLAAANVLKAC